jgi:hypothetical protein
MSMTPSLPGNPYGSLKEGILTIHGLVISDEQISRRSSPGRWTTMWDELTQTSSGGGNGGVHELQGLKTLILQARDGQSVVDYFGLMIAPVEQGHGTIDGPPKFRRVGLVVCRDVHDSLRTVRPSFHTVGRIFEQDLSIIELV